MFQKKKRNEQPFCHIDTKNVIWIDDSKSKLFNEIEQEMNQSMNGIKIRHMPHS